MKFKVYPYKKASKSARDLSRSLGCKRILTNVYQPRRTDILINWGSTTMPHLSANHDLNKVKAVRRAANKLDTFEHIFSENPDIIPEWTTDIAQARAWLESENCKVYCRLSLTAHSGRGIVVAETLEDLVDAQLYTKGAKNKYEFRVHVFKNKIIDIQQKKRRRGTNPSNLIRNHVSGWVFCREDIDIPYDLTESAIKGVDSLGLDFGAVDIGYRVRDNKSFIFEINTAPGLEGTTLTKYTQAFENYKETL